ncbi:MAG: ankyrin repeat domain-containing protein [Bryobacteraceae bacterium]
MTHYTSRPASLFRLLDAGANINAITNDGQTPLHKPACRIERIGMVKTLLDRGANVNAQDFRGTTALYLATLLNKAPEDSILKLSLNEDSILMLLLDAGADPNISRQASNTPLMLAASSGYLNRVRSLLTHGAKVNDRGEGDKTALMEAAYHGQDAIVALLIESGADVNACSSSGRTVLGWARLGGHRSTIAVLERAMDNVIHGASTDTLLNAGNQLLWVIEKDAVLMNRINEVDSLIQLIKLSLEKSASFVPPNLTISGYESDTRELYEIPEVRFWCSTVARERPFVPAIVHKRTLDWFVFCLTEISTERRSSSVYVKVKSTDDLERLCRRTLEAGEMFFGDALPTGSGNVMEFVGEAEKRFRSVMNEG